MYKSIWTDLDGLSQADNARLRRMLQELENQQREAGFRVFQSVAGGSQTISTGVDTALSFDSQYFMNDLPYVSGHPTIMWPLPGSIGTVRVPGVYAMWGAVRWAASTTSGLYRIGIRKNGSDLVGEFQVEWPAISSTNPLVFPVSTIWDFAIGDTVELIVQQTVAATLAATVSLDAAPQFAAVWVSKGNTSGFI